MRVCGSRLGLGLAWLSFSCSGLASADPGDPSRLSELFKERFKQHYAAGRCGDNIFRFIAAARDLGESLAEVLGEANVIVIRNAGGSVFGLVNVELARDEEIFKGQQRKPSERNWYHHVVLVHGGKVYDFDYTNEPRVETIAEYCERMFLDEKAIPTDSYGFYVGRDRKLADYTIESISASEYFRFHSLGQKPKLSDPVSLKDFIQASKK
jgi:hypothetical protein